MQRKFYNVLCGFLFAVVVAFLALLYCYCVARLIASQDGEWPVFEFHTGWLGQLSNPRSCVRWCSSMRCVVALPVSGLVSERCFRSNLGNIGGIFYLGG